MIMESPLIQELLAEGRQEILIIFLKARFGRLPPQVHERVRQVVDEKELIRLAWLAGLCSRLETFTMELSPVPKAKKGSSRRKRRS